jgi:hypothetical protein
MQQVLRSASWILAGVAVLGVHLCAQERPPVLFNTAFEGASLARVEPVSDTNFRVYLLGQQDMRGRNRQATWVYFRMDRVKDRDLTITLTGYLPGEYNDGPAPHMTAQAVPVYSYDGQTWHYFAEQTWDDVAKEGTVRLRPPSDSVWIATTPPYTHSRLLKLLSELSALPHVRLEVMGQSVRGRDLHLVTVTNFSKPEAGKKTVWLQARQHAWESLTSYIAEGAMKFVTSDDPAARELRDRFVFVFTPMLDPDGCVLGGVRFNANGYDVNRHWDEVDLSNPEWLRNAPEIWYPKKAVRDHVAAGRRVDLMVNLHNTISEYLVANPPTNEHQPRLQRFNDLLMAETQFDPARPVQISARGANTSGRAEPWWRTYGVPYVLIETRIAFGQKMGARPTAEHRLKFGRELITTMAKSVE